jgi:hypothetical protein
MRNGDIAPCILRFSTNGDQLHHSLVILSVEKKTLVPTGRTLRGPQKWSGYCGEEKNPLPPLNNKP